MCLKKVLLVLMLFLAAFSALHATPEMALRTKVIAMGYPVAGASSPIVEGDFHHAEDREKYKDGSGVSLTMTEPPFEKATETKLSNYLVIKRGFLYFADYYGEV